MNRNSQFATENKVDEKLQEEFRKTKNYLINFNYNNENI
jgi:hypothetical protein